MSIDWHAYSTLVFSWRVLLELQFPVLVRLSQCVIWYNPFLLNFLPQLLNFPQTVGCTHPTTWCVCVGGGGGRGGQDGLLTSKHTSTDTLGGPET